MKKIVIKALLYLLLMCSCNEASIALLAKNNIWMNLIGAVFTIILLVSVFKLVRLILIDIKELIDSFDFF